jgi:hypothetical protein
MKTGFVLLSFLSAVAMAQSPGTFRATDNMTASRAWHTATLLLDGRVLIAGGAGDNSDSSISSSAEIYDPATGTFTPTGNLTRARYAHSATLLPDGRVLIAGGYGPTGSTKSGDGPPPKSYGELTSAEIYDPSTGTFTVTGDMIAAGGPAVLLPNGKVLISAGNASISAYASAQVELYDPPSATFSAKTIEAGATQTATLLSNGKVLLAYANDTGTGEIYDSSADSFSPTDNIYYQTATLLMNGRVLFISNRDNDYHLGDETQLYDPSTGEFTAAGSMTIGRDSHAATLLPDGTVLVAGSWLPGGGALASAEIYDPVLGTFGPTGSMTRGRYFQTATLLNNGQVLITGGYSPFPAATSSAELYTPAVSISAPVLLSLSGDGRGQGAVWHAATGEIASPGNPAVVGEILSMYTTSLVAGGVIPPRVVIGGRLAEILYFGASSYPGYNQVNFRLPSGVASGPPVPVRLTYLGRPSNEVTIGVQ